MHLKANNLKQEFECLLLNQLNVLLHSLYSFTFPQLPPTYLFFFLPQHTCFHFTMKSNTMENHNHNEHSHNGFSPTIAQAPEPWVPPHIPNPPCPRPFQYPPPQPCTASSQTWSNTQVTPLRHVTGVLSLDWSAGGGGGGG